MEAVLAEAEMTGWAERLGATLRGGDVVLLEGPMGAGKTTLTRALARGLGVVRPERVSSPTYTVCMIHPCRAPERSVLALVHLDLFRLGESGSIGTAGFESLGLEHDELPGPERVMVVEWSELWADPPAQALRVRLSRTPDDRRRLVVEGLGSGWIDRLASAELAAPGA